MLKTHGTKTKMAGQGSDPTDAEIKGAFRAGHFLRLANRKPRMKSLWYPG